MLTDERRLILQTVEKIASRLGRSYWLRCACEDRQPEELWTELAGAGLTGVGVPVEYGGSGYGLVEAGIVQEALARHGIPLLQFLTTHLSRVPIMRYGSREQVDRYVRPTCAAGKKISLCVTEAEAGSETWRIKTYAERHGPKFILRGQKTFITGAAESDFMLVVARTRRYEEVVDKREGISLFIMDTASEGVRFERLNIDMRSPEYQYIIYFDGVEMDDGNLVGREGMGHQYLFDGLNVERVLIAACSVGLGDYVLSKALEYARQRVVFGRPIGSYQGLQFRLARAKIHLEAARLMVYNAASKFDGGEPVGGEANMAKYMAAEASLEAFEAAMQVFGGNAYAQETDIITLYPIIRLFKTAPVTDELVLSYVGRQVLGLPKSY
ncbi:MAG: acyl-CoA dehydrogenase family protein [Nitrososphaerota archaeon]